jgi:hypothetical protein
MTRARWMDKAGEGWGVAISGMGLVSSLGVGAVTACAAARAGLSRPRELVDQMVFDPVEVEMRSLCAHTVGTTTDGLSRLGRLARLGSLGLADFVESSALTAREWSESALVMALSSGYYLDAAEMLDDEQTPAGDHPPRANEARTCARSCKRSWCRAFARWQVYRLRTRSSWTRGHLVALSAKGMTTLEIVSMTTAP